MEKIRKVCETRWLNWCDCSGVLENEAQQKQQLWWNKTSASTVHYICLYTSVDQYQVSLTAESFFFHFLSSTWPNSIHRHFSHPFHFAFSIIILKLESHMLNSWGRPCHLESRQETLKAIFDACSVSGATKNISRLQCWADILRFAYPFRETAVPGEEPSSCVGREQPEAVLLLSGCSL